ncbi:MAG: DUF1844 domain-containing protein [Acidobacteriota bacterium]
MEEPRKSKMKITDHRQFTPQGERRKQEPPEGRPERSEAPRAAPSSEAPRAAPSSEAATAPQQGAPSPFAELLMSLFTSALVKMGELPDPQTGQPQKNLEEASQVIDILICLREKTAGNLAPEEDASLGNMLYELQMIYTQKRAQ